jgi:glutamate formiminotransferase/formiminotetrahydrofolate cyclodeaminase
MKQIVECVPNFSEGRRPEVIDEIVVAIEQVEGIKVLDRTSDADHNRTVITFVGPPDTIGDAAFAAIATAAKLIDMDQQHGEHPRMGAADVVPFVPIAGVTLEDCVEIARQVGARVGEELAIPVFLYEAAATRPDRVDLGKVRPKSHQYEQKKADVGRVEKWAPDFGPAKVGRAGATAIGARQPLIAYNAFLSTDDAGIAENIAKAVRHSSGGLRHVKARGFLVEGKAQVSMNLTDYTKTPIHRAVEMIRREAARYGVSIESGELIGMIPQQALTDAAVWYLQMDNFEPRLVIENGLIEGEE